MFGRTSKPNNCSAFIFNFSAHILRVIYLFLASLHFIHGCNKKSGTSGWIRNNLVFSSDCRLENTAEIMPFLHLFCLMPGFGRLETINWGFIYLVCHFYSFSKEYHQSYSNFNQFKSIIFRSLTLFSSLYLKFVVSKRLAVFAR